MSLKDRLIKRLKEVPSSKQELRVYFGYDKRIDKLLSRMISKGKIAKKNGRYQYIKTDKSKKNKKNITTIEAVVVKHTGTFAFATPSNGGDDYFIPGRELGNVLVGDKVLLLPDRKDGRVFARVLSIIEENNLVTGKVVECDNRLALQLDGYNESMVVPIKKTSALQPCLGESVAAEITSRKESSFCCVVKKRFGDSSYAHSAAKSIIYNNGIRTHFNTNAKAETNDIVSAFDTSTITKDRIDLRDALIFTIDSADTKDIDDAVSLQKTDNGYLLGVHIADVSHYVTPNTSLDNVAYERQFSFYFPTGVIPMLPPELSNGLCSLSPREDRLCFSCIMELSNSGELIASSFVKTVICSRVQGVYSEVNAILNGIANDSIKAKYRGCIPTLKSMQKLAMILNKNRVREGSIDFNLKETGYKIKKDKVCSIYFKERGKSEKIIEEFMLMANRSTAAVSKEIGLPIIYRGHAAPNIERLSDVIKTLSTISNENINFSVTEVKSKDIATLIDKYNDTQYEHYANNAVLRCMAKAEYSNKSGMHFGLATDDYCHFTSPIRRYSDLFTHRILTDYINKRPQKNIIAEYGEIAKNVAIKANLQEELFVRTERLIEDCFKAEAMADHIGEIFTGIINGITENSVFVLLDNSAEGRIAISDLSNRYLLIDENYRLYSNDGSIEYRIGDAISVKIVAVRVDLGKIDLLPEVQ